MKRDEKNLVRSVAREWIEHAFPGELEEFDIVFDVVYHAVIERMKMKKPDPAAVWRSDGFPVDASFVEGTLISSAIWIAAGLIRFAIDRPRQTGSERLLEELEKLKGQKDDATMARDIARRVDALGDELARLREETGRGRRDITLAPESIPAKPVRGGGERPADVIHGLDEEAGAPARPPDVHSTDRAAPPPDLDMRVVLDDSGGRTTLCYTLHSPAGGEFHYTAMGSRPIKGSLADFRADLIQRIEKLMDSMDGDDVPLAPGEVMAGLRGIGRDLFDALFSSEMRAAYRRFRGSARTLRITSDEPWIPWELVKPYDDSDPREIIDDDFLCARFRLTRWLSGSGQVNEIHMKRLACIDAGSTAGSAPLARAGEEREMVAEFARARAGVVDASPPTAERATLMNLLGTGELSWLHFIGHGDFNAARPDESRIRLDGGRFLRPADLHGPMQTALKRERPLVFFNACGMGQQGWALTGLGGWARRWIGGCGCSAFIGPMWSVDDRLAHEFARRFYQALGANETLGAAVLEARLHVRTLDPSDPTWLAYSIHGHPNARLVL